MSGAKPTAAERRAIIEADMRAFRWVRGVSGRAYARAWDIPYERVRADAAAVSATLQAEHPDDFERARRDVLDELDEAADLIRDALDEARGGNVSSADALIRAGAALANIAVTRARCLGRKP